LLAGTPNTYATFSLLSPSVVIHFCPSFNYLNLFLPSASSLILHTQITFYHILPPKLSSNIMSSTNEHGQGASHATGQSSVPESIQKAAPKKLEDQLPDSVHDTNSNKDTGKVSHATGPSMVPQALQEAVPKSVEEFLPESIHPTNPK